MNSALARWIFFAACAAAARGSDRSVLAATTANWFLTQGGLGEAPFVRGFEIRETVEFVPEKLKLDVHLVKAANGHFRCEAARPGVGTLVQAWDGRLGWEAAPDLGLGLISNFSSYVWITHGDLLLGAHAFPVGSKFTLAGRTEVDGQTCVVGKTMLPDGVEMTCCFELKGRKLLRFSVPVGAGQILTDDFEDFRPVDGLSVPFRVKTTVGSEIVVQRRSAVSLNPLLDEGSVILTTAQVDEALAVSAILARHDASIGSAAALSRIHTWIIRTTLEMPSNGTTSTQTISRKMPNLVLEETDARGVGTTVRGYDGKTAWEASDLQGYRTLKPPELAQLLFGEGLRQLTQTSSNYPLRRRVRDRIVQGRATDGIALATEAGSMGVFYYDKENGRLLLQVVLPATGDRTHMTESAVEYSDYRVKDGLDIPYCVAQTNALFKTVSTVTSVEINPPLDDAMFRPRLDD